MKKEFNSLFLLFCATIITIVIVPLGVLYNCCKAVYHAYKLKPLYVIWYIVLYWLKIIYQLWNVCKYLFLKLAIALDLIWNATSGEMIEDCVTTKEETLYGKGNVTVSAATGNLEESKELNKVGLGFTFFLSKTLGKNHSIDAWKKEQEYRINE